MRAILIGSRAYKTTNWNDTDVICDAEWKAAWNESYGCLEEKDSNISSHYVTCGGIFEIAVPPQDSAHFELLMIGDNWPQEQIEESLPLSAGRTPIEYLAALKKAHLILPTERWRRQIEEYSTLKKALGCSIYTPTNYAATIFKLHRFECLAKAKKHPKLAQSKDAFFGKEEYEIFDHDDIHRALAYPNLPAYEGMKNGEVWCDKKLWEKLNHEEQLRCVIEEASILALERSILPALFLKKGYCGSKWAYEFALQKICTTITSGWFRDFCIESWDEACSNMPDFISTFFDGIKRNAIKCIKPEVLANGS